MMKNNPNNIEKFKITGKVFIWAYPENKNNYPGWNFTADKRACDELYQLLTLMDQYDWTSLKTISTSLPGQRQLNAVNIKAPWKSKTRLTLKCKKTADENYWQIIKHADELEIVFGKNKLIELQKAIKGIPKNEGDFAITDENDNNFLYIWWNLEN